MPIMLQLSGLAARHLLEGACHVLGLRAGESGLDKVVDFLTDRFRDQSLRLPQALRRANDGAWKALEVALAGESLWSWLDRAEHKAFRQQVRAFLDATPLAGLPGHGPEFRQVCLKELRAARKAGLLLGGEIDPRELARQAGSLARFGDPQSLLEVEWRAIDDLAGELRQAGYAELARFVALRPEQHGSCSVLASGVRFFFRREVESDRELFQGLTWAKLEAMQQAGDHAFAALAEALASHAAALETILTGVQETVTETHGAVLDIQAEQQRQGGQLHELYQAVLDLKRRHDLPAAEVRPGDSLVIANEGERRLVRAVMEKFRALPAEQQSRLPALLNSLAQLEVATGDFGEAQQNFQRVAASVNDRAAEAEAHHNAYGAALEKGDFAAALDALRRAAALDPGRFAPFPLGKYEPERLLGAGGFGVAFLCRNRHSDGRVVVKTLRADALDRQVSDVFREARVLEELEHTAIIRLRDCDYADAAQARPYLVMDYFDGVTLAEQVERNGPLSPDQLLALARPVAEALRAAHARGILHRDVKPANLLVRRDGDGWRVKLIDFGLALKQSVLSNTVSVAARGKSATAYNLAGTLDYAAPEQMGKLPGVAAGPYTDVYGFAKTCCYALFKTVQPLRKHWRDVPEKLADLLEQCLNETPDGRPPSFDPVLEGLALLGKPAAAPPAVPEPPPPGPLPSGQIYSLKNPKDRRNRWWAEVPGGELPRLEGHNGEVLAVACGPDGREILSGGADGTVRLWQAETGLESACMHGHAGEVWAVAFTPDGKRAVSAGKDRSVRLWDLQTGRQKRVFEARTNRTVALSPDGSLAISGSVSDGMVRLWETETGRELRRFKGHMSWVMAAAFGPDGRLALTGSADGTARLWDVASGRELRRLQGHTDQVLAVAISPTGRHALSGGADKQVLIWDLKSGQAVTRKNTHEPVHGVAFSPDGRRTLWGAEGNVVLMCDVEDAGAVWKLEGHFDRVMCVAFGPDGGYAVSGGKDEVVRLWKLDR